MLGERNSPRSEITAADAGKVGSKKKGKEVIIVSAAGQTPGYSEAEGRTTTKDKNLVDADYDVSCKVTGMPTAAEVAD